MRKVYWVGTCFGIGDREEDQEDPVDTAESEHARSNTIVQMEQDQRDRISCFSSMDGIIMERYLIGSVARMKNRICQAIPSAKKP
jgi:hypothetical protein